jgi:hypothetical protein
MSSLSLVLERYFFRTNPLGVAIFHPSFASPLAFGQPSQLAFRALSSLRGFGQLHREDVGVSLFGAVFETGHTLIAQLAYQPIDLVSRSTWLGFVRLSTLITLILAGGLSLPPETPSAPSLIPRPRPPLSPRPLRAEAPLYTNPPV